ncbi:unnamed protein product [Ectocarpus sp. 13 AM-2016]
MYDTSHHKNGGTVAMINWTKTHTHTRSRFTRGNDQWFSRSTGMELHTVTCTKPSTQQLITLQKGLILYCHTLVFAEGRPISSMGVHQSNTKPIPHVDKTPSHRPVRRVHVQRSVQWVLPISPRTVNLNEHWSQEAQQIKKARTKCFRPDRTRCHP